MKASEPEHAYPPNNKGPSRSITPGSNDGGSPTPTRSLNQDTTRPEFITQPVTNLNSNSVTILDKSTRNISIIEPVLDSTLHKLSSYIAS
jgi:hypothetical protein